MSKKISELPSASTPLGGTELVEVVQGGVSKKVAVSNIGGGGGGGMPGSGYAQYLAALLEPDAIEPVQKDSFSYTVGPSVTKMLLASWATRLGGSGRMEQRNPQRAMPLSGTTLTGLSSGSLAVMLDPSLVSYADPWATYYGRLQQIAELPVKNIAITAANQKKPFLPGAYGAIITQVTCFDCTWIILQIHGTYGANLWDEISDTSTNRIGDSLSLPISKRVAGTLASGNGVSSAGSVSYVLLPSTWSAITDPVSSSYTFRDDFMGTALEVGTTWNRAQSAVGNVEIDTDYQWCKCFGSGSWGVNGLRTQASTTRAVGVKMVVDVYVPIGAVAAGGTNIVGWSDGTAHSQAAFAHGVNFAGSNIINVYEGGVSRGAVGSGYTEGSIYRVRITLGASSATYEIQGGTEYPAIASGSWTDITPGTSSNSTSTLYAAAAAWNGSGYISDMRVY